MNRIVRIPHVAVDLSDRRVVSWRLLAAVLAVEVVLTAAFNLVVFRSEWFLETVFRPVFVATGGLVGPTLLVNAVNVLLILAGLLMLVGGCASVTSGWNARNSRWRRRSPPASGR